MAEGWLARLAEVAAVLAVAGYLVALWFVARVNARLKLQRRGGLIALTMLGSCAAIIVVGVAASMFLVAAHEDGGAPTGMDYLQIWLAMFGPVGAAGVALLVWICMLVGAEGEKQGGVAEHLPFSRGGDPQTKRPEVSLRPLFW